MKKSEIKKVLALAVELNSDGDNGGGHLADVLYETYDWGSKKQPEGFKIDLADAFGGEGRGEEFWYIFSIKNLTTNEETFVKFEGFYSSHCGHEFDDSEDFEIVESREVVVKKWFKVGRA